MSIVPTVPAGNPQAHFRIAPNDESARALLPVLIAVPFTVTDAVSQVVRFPIAAGTFVRGALVKFGTAFDAANVDVGDSTDADGFIVNGACTAGIVINSYGTDDVYGTQGVLAEVGGKFYSAAGLLTLTFADAITAGSGTLYVEVFELGV